MARRIRPIFVWALAGAAIFAWPGLVRGDAVADFARLRTQFSQQFSAKKYVDAEHTAIEMRKLSETALQDKPDLLGTSLYCQAIAVHNQRRFAEAEPLYRRSLEIREKVLEADNPLTAWTLQMLAKDCLDQGRYAEAEPLFNRALAIREKVLKPDSLETAQTIYNLAEAHYAQGRYAESAPYYERALAIREKVLKPNDLVLAESLSGLAAAYHDSGRFAESEALLKRAIGIRERVLGVDNPTTAVSLNMLAKIYMYEGHYAESEVLYKRAMAIWAKAFGTEHYTAAESLNNLGDLYTLQGRFAEAETLLKQSLAMREKLLGPDSPLAAQSMNDLANVYRDKGDRARYAEAESLYKRGLAIREKALGPDHPAVALSLGHLAKLYCAEARYAEAEPLDKRAIAIFEKTLGADHPNVSFCLYNLARQYKEQGRDEEAEPLVDRAIANFERTHRLPEWQVCCYSLRAELSWQAKRRGEAVADLRSAMDLAEQLRGRSSGGALERAEYFGHFTNIYEQMVVWQTELGDPGEVMAAIERARARSLLDDLNLSGADLDVGRSAADRKKLQAREGELKARAAALEQQLAGAKDPPARTALEKSLADARAALYQHYRDQRSTNPVYRNLLAVGTGPIRLSQVQRELVGRGGLMLVYLLGDQSGYVLAIGPRMAEVTVLSLDRTAAQTLEVKPGPLTAARLRAALSNEAGSGVLQMLASKERAAQATAKLAVLWKVLVPEAQRKTLADGSVKRLIVVPDGPLALLPMETLVVKAGEKPEYLLDVGPPVVYGPSATVLHNLAERPIAHRSGDRKPVLSVGDPAYPQPDGKEPAAANSELVAQLDAKSRVAIAGGHLARLPYTAWESAWVSESFTKNGFAVDQLLQQNATKLNVCQQIGGRQVVHLACHGMADQSYGNFFGALALTPGPHAQSDAADDGFLTLAEICELNLKDCELALLSACETNFGPQQRGEGVWALSRGFLVAGARRVVASDWLVDDEAAASLVSYYCNLVARAEKEGGRPDYADSLREAKRWVRRQDNWSSPFYWAPFVLLGPK